MTGPCAPFRVELSRVRLPASPPRPACRALRGREDHPDCVCRRYPGRGWYVVGACGHAHSWCLHIAAASVVAERLNGVEVLRA